MLQFKDPWDRNSYLICTDISIYHNMPCSVGTYFNEKLRHCVPEGYDPPSCPDQHCKNDADCNQKLTVLNYFKPKKWLDI